MSTPRMIGLGILLTATCASGALAAPAPFDAELNAIQEEWAVANYQIADTAAKQQAFEKLSGRAHEFSARNPGRAEALIWEGIVLSTYAGARGGLGALSLAKKSRAVLESALKIDPDALQGSAYTSLGALYSKVPGFPLGFGDDDKARELLQKALALNPDGIDSNYFYAEFLCDQKHCDEAVPYLEKAQHAPPRTGREEADVGRRSEVTALMAKAQKARG